MLRPNSETNNPLQTRIALPLEPPNNTRCPALQQASGIECRVTETKIVSPPSNDTGKTNGSNKNERLPVQQKHRSINITFRAHFHCPCP